MFHLRALSCSGNCKFAQFCKQLGRKTHSFCKQALLSSVILHQKHFKRFLNQKVVLGIETSCDDTGAAVVNESGVILGEALNSQVKTHVEFGGILPPIARDLHCQHIERIVTEALNKAQLTVQDVDAIAVTVKPGLAMSLSVGLDYAKELVRTSGKPMIPIHHMEAHALTPRMLEKIEFPYLVFLLSGGHCLLAVVRSVEDYLLIGRGLDDSPGEAFDKTARRLGIKNLPECDGLSGGASIEMVAKNGDPKAFEFPHVLSRNRDCYFSMTGVKEKAQQVIEKEESRQGVLGGNILPNVADVCASFQHGILKHLARKLQRAFLFCELKGLLPEKDRVMVVSGGVASNMYIRQGLENVCQIYNCRIVCPAPKLCTDNGIMIAWNGMEKLMIDKGIVEDFESVTIQPRCPLGEDITEDVVRCHIKLPKLKI